MSFPLWNKKTENLVIDTAIDPLPELREELKMRRKQWEDRYLTSAPKITWIEGKWDAE